VAEAESYVTGMQIRYRDETRAVKMHAIVENETFENEGVHFLSGHDRFSYRDGDWLENNLLKILRKADDLSSDSREIELLGKGWASQYHVSVYRSIPYRSLQIGSQDLVLEVGSVCGAITRLLGERACEVVALEGSPRRAVITRARTRGQDNVSVLCASFSSV